MTWVTGVTWVTWVTWDRGDRGNRDMGDWATEGFYRLKLKMESLTYLLG